MIYQETDPVSAEENSHASARLLSLAKLVADWADQRPVIDSVYIFGSRARGDAGPGSDLDLAIELVPTPTTEATEDWTQQNEADFQDLKATLGVPLSLHIEPNDAAWPAIREAAQEPIHTVGKVICCLTPPRDPPAAS